MDKTRLKLWAMLCFLFTGILLYAQERVIIQLKNPSFEDVPSHSHTPKGWVDCGFAGESEPDVQPCGEFGVTKLPLDGKAYLGMVTRDNNTWERVSQTLSSPLKHGNCYGFSIYLAKSPQYMSRSRLTEEMVNYVHNVKLRIYGGFSPCQQEQLLAESPLINNFDWIQYNFRFHPENDYPYLMLEAFYETPKLFPYNGNLLLDHASAITPINCEDSLPQGAYTVAPDMPIDSMPEKSILTVVPPSVPKFIKGELIPLKEIKFINGRRDLTSSAYLRLNKLADLLILNPTLMVEINVHLNHRYDQKEAEDLSVKRAIVIENYLLDNGVRKQRFKIRGLGNGYPLDPKNLSDDDERVEVKVAEF